MLCDLVQLSIPFCTACAFPWWAPGEAAFQRVHANFVFSSNICNCSAIH